MEVALALFIVLAPMPFGAVGPRGRMLVELGAVVLLVLWLIDQLAGRSVRPSRIAMIGALGLLLFAAVQTVPLPAVVVSGVSPETERIRSGTLPSPAVISAEEDLLDSDPESGRRGPTLSLVPQATASALRTGVASVVLLMVGSAVAAKRGVKLLAVAALLSGAFQGLYGLLVVTSGHDRIWNTPKEFALDAATGTFINPNHFASYLALVLPCGLALVLWNARHSFLSRERRRRWASIGGDGGRDILLLLLLGLGVGGLFTSRSRAGIALGLMALALAAITGTGHSTRARIAALVLVVMAAALPLMHLGPDQLIDSYVDAGAELEVEGGRAAVWKDTIRVAAAFPATGSGFGTFAYVYPLFRSGEVRRFYKHAHHDSLQVAAEGGLVGLALMGALLLPVLVGIAGGLRGRQGPLSNGLAAGLGAVLLHSLIDFPFHIPAIAATAAALAGALLVREWNVAKSS